MKNSGGASQERERVSYVKLYFLKGSSKLDSYCGCHMIDRNMRVKHVGLLIRVMAWLCDDIMADKKGRF